MGIIRAHMAWNLHTHHDMTHHPWDALTLHCGASSGESGPCIWRRTDGEGPMTPNDLSTQLRQEAGEYLARRRGGVGASLVAVGAMGLITLYQMGRIAHLPDPPLPGFDADKVDASAEAYAKLAMPDGVLGLGSYAVTAAFAAMGGEDRATTHPWMPLALAAKVAFDTVQAGKLSVDQWTKHRAFCVWCLLASGATAVTVPLVIPEARAAVTHLLAERRR